MSELTQQILKANERFVKQSLSQGGFDEVSKYPSRNLAVLTCMDTRLLSFLEPVSYTHLRAHETEADLVCRLHRHWDDECLESRRR